MRLAYVRCLVPHEDFKRGERRLVAITRKIASLIASGYLEELPTPPALGFPAEVRYKPGRAAPLAKGRRHGSS